MSCDVHVPESLSHHFFLSVGEHGCHTSPVIQGRGHGRGVDAEAVKFKLLQPEQPFVTNKSREQEEIPGEKVYVLQNQGASILN